MKLSGHRNGTTVIPAQAGISGHLQEIPAFAGMTPGRAMAAEERQP